jgi:hypothetical protein
MLTKLIRWDTSVVSRAFWFGADMRGYNVFVNSIVTFVAVDDLAGAPMNHHILYCNFHLGATAASAIGTGFEMLIEIDNRICFSQPP